MREIILDLRGLISSDEEGGNLADIPAHLEVEGMLLDYKGKVIRIHITVVRKGVSK